MYPALCRRWSRPPAAFFVFDAQGHNGHPRTWRGLRYDNGFTSYIEVLDSERSLFQARLQLTQTQGQLYVALINLYKALGGRWVKRAEELAPRPGIADRT